MATNKTGMQGKAGRSGGQGASKSGSQKQSSGGSRKSSMKEDEKEGSSTRGGSNK